MFECGARGSSCESLAWFIVQGSGRFSALSHMQPADFWLTFRTVSSHPTQVCNSLRFPFGRTLQKNERDGDRQTVRIHCCRTVYCVSSEKCHCCESFPCTGGLPSPGVPSGHSGGLSRSDVPLNSDRCVPSATRCKRHHATGYVHMFTHCQRNVTVSSHKEPLKPRYLSVFPYG